MPSALIVDDDADLRDSLAEIVALQGFRTATAGSLAEARQRLASESPDVVLVDLVLPDGSGMDLLGDAGEAPRPEVILVTGHATVDSAVAALRTGARDYLVKPIDVPRLQSVLANVSRTLALKAEIHSLRGELRRLGRFGHMIGGSPPMQRVYDLIARVAPTQATVLVTGESGTGKELVAHTLHEMSTRRAGPFVAINCGAVPANLIESQLFGHERGSFTGATQQHRGLFERSSGGTLFLDEITEMPMELQSRLLRVLETGEVVRVGGEAAIAVDVRLVAASNRPPEDAVRTGALREDLYYRLHVFPIVLPPLRDRGEDIERLAEHFLEQLNQAEGTSKWFGDRARERMRRHRWPGNVRELKNLVHRAFIMSDDEIEVPLAPAVAPAAPAGTEAGSLDGIRVGLPLDDVERRVILATLEACGGDKKQAAETLGISLKTLYNRLNVYSARSGADPDRGSPPGPGV